LCTLCSRALARLEPALARGLHPSFVVRGGDLYL
jgi:hypothetical protein